MAIKVSGTEVISDDKRILNNEDLPDIRPSLLLDFANSKTLDPRITFTRGSTATYWDGKTTAKAEENLVTQSQGFDNVVWYKDGTTITANDTAAPDGTTTADRITDSGVGTSHYAAHTLAISTSATYSISCYIKYGGGNGWVLVGFTGAVAGAYFDIQNGTTGSTGSSVSGSSITDVGGGWYRCELQTTYTLSPAYPQVRLVPSNGTATYTADGSYVWAWGFQVEQRSSATAYTVTTTSPIVKYQPVLQTAASGEARFDHDPVTGESKGLLIEEARTNLDSESEDFSTWSEQTASVSASSRYRQDDVIIAPNGTLTGTKISASTSSDLQRIYKAFFLSASTIHVFSVYVKSDDYNITLFDSQTQQNQYIRYDLDAITSTDLNGNTENHGIEDIGNGWRRIFYSAESSLSGLCTPQVRLETKTGTITDTFAGDGFTGVYIWGAQVEQGSFPTSYIPTSGSTVTRAVDSAYVDEAVGGYLSTPDISMYMEFEYIGTPSGTKYLLSLTNKDYDNRFEFRGQTDIVANRVATEFFGVGDRSVTAAANIQANTAYKIAASLTEGGMKACGSDDNTPSETSDSIKGNYNTSRLSIGGNWSGGSNLSHRCRKVAIYPKALSSATLQAMTEE